MKGTMLLHVEANQELPLIRPYGQGQAFDECVKVDGYVI